MIDPGSKTLRSRMIVNGGKFNRRRALVVAAKPPCTGEVKTRLCPPLSTAQAADLYECLLADILAKMGSYKGADLWIAHTPEGEDYFKGSYGGRIKLLAQRGIGLSERVPHIFADLFNSSYRSVLVTDSDSPTVPLSTIKSAYRNLDEEGCDVVIGPSLDGGYYLIGLKSPAEGLFRDIPWSSEGVLEKTLENTSRLGLKTALLPCAYDIDMEEDLERLWKEMTDKSDLQQLAPKTHEFVTGLFGGKRGHSGF